MNDKNEDFAWPIEPGYVAVENLHGKSFFVEVEGKKLECKVLLAATLADGSKPRFVYEIYGRGGNYEGQYFYPGFVKSVSEAREVVGKSVSVF